MAIQPRHFRLRMSLTHDKNGSCWLFAICGIPHCTCQAFGKIEKVPVMPICERFVSLFGIRNASKTCTVNRTVLSTKCYIRDGELLNVYQTN